MAPRDPFVHRSTTVRLPRTGVVAALVAVALAVLLAPWGEPVSAQPLPNQELSINAESTWQVTGVGPSETIAWNAQVFTMVETQGRVYVGGRFTGVRRNASSPTTNQAYLAAFDVNTGAWISGFRPNLNGPVFSLAVAPSGQLLVGGEFSRVGGANTGALVALDPMTGQRSSGFTANVAFGDRAALVKDIEVTASGIYIGGNFSTITNAAGTTVSRSRLAKLNPTTGAVITQWNASAAGAKVMAMSLSPDRTRLYVGGYFSSVNNTAGTRGLAAVNTSNGQLVAGVAHGVPTDIPNCCSIVPFDVVATGDKVYVASESHNLFVYNASNMSRIGFFHTDAGGGDFQALALQGTRLYAGGHYWSAHSWDTGSYSTDRTMWWYWNNVHAKSPTVKPAAWATAYDAATGQHLESFAPDIAAISGIWSILPASDGKVWFGGDVTRGGSTYTGGFAVFKPVTTPSKGANLAARRPATQSSTNGNKTAARGTDGMLNGDIGDGADRYGDAKTLNQANPWWQTDLGSTRNIAMIRVWKPATCCIGAIDGAKVFVSNTPFTSTNPATTQAQPGVTTFTLGTPIRRADIVTSVSGRYVRVQLPRAGVLSLDEVEIFEAAQAPSANPVAPSACQVTVSGGALRVSWTRAANDGAQAFVVRRARNSTSYFWANRTAAPSTSWTDTNVNAADGYRYRVESVSGAKSSAPRNCSPSPISPVAGSVTPKAPVSCTVNVGNGTIAVNWQRAANDNAQAFIVRRRRDGGAFFWAARVGATNSWTDRSVSGNSSYEYRVESVNGTRSSAVTSCNSSQSVLAPTGLRSTSHTRERVVLNYTTPAGVGAVEIARNGTVVATDNNNWFTDTGLNANTSYAYRVRSVGAGGARSAWSSAVTVRTNP
jgi:hypothetical protein